MQRSKVVLFKHSKVCLELILNGIEFFNIKTNIELHLQFTVWCYVELNIYYSTICWFTINILFPTCK